MDLVDNAVSYKFDSESPFKQNEMYAITRIQDRINLLLSLAQKDGFVAKELQRDQVDLLKESLTQLPTSNPSNIIPATTVKPRRPYQIGHGNCSSLYRISFLWDLHV